MENLYENFVETLQSVRCDSFSFNSRKNFYFSNKIWLKIGRGLLIEYLHLLLYRLTPTICQWIVVCVCLYAFVGCVITFNRINYISPTLKFWVRFYAVSFHCCFVCDILLDIKSWSLFTFSILWVHMWSCLFDDMSCTFNATGILCVTIPNLIRKHSTLSIGRVSRWDRSSVCVCHLCVIFQLFADVRGFIVLEASLFIWFCQQFVSILFLLQKWRHSLESFT